jgi:hypothetical protein
MHIFWIKISILILMSFICFEPKSSYSGRRLYLQLSYVMLYTHQYKQSKQSFTHSYNYKTAYTGACTT